MEEDKKPVVVRSKEMTQEQNVHFADVSVQAFEMLCDVTDFLAKIGVNLLQATVSIKVPGEQYPKLMVMANPGLDPEDLKQLIEAIASDSDQSVKQAQTLAALASARALMKDMGPAGDIPKDCEGCPAKDDCFPPTKETVH